MVVAAGDALMLFDAAAVRFDRPGIVAFGPTRRRRRPASTACSASRPDGDVRLFLQKPSLADQARYGAINARGQAILDIAVMSFDAAAAMAMFRAFDVQPDQDRAAFSAAMEKLVLDKGLDLYREICCALGTEATAEHHRTSCRGQRFALVGGAACRGPCRVVAGAALRRRSCPQCRVPALRHDAATDHQRPGTVGARRPAVGAGHSA